MFWEEFFFSPNIISFIVATLVSSAVLYFVFEIIVKGMFKKVSLPSKWIVTTFLLTLSGIFILIQTSQPLSLNQATATIEAVGTRAVLNARATWEAEIFPTIVSLLDPLISGNITFNGNMDSLVASTHRFSFVAGVSDPKSVPADITFQRCYIMSGNAEIYCGQQTRNIWSLGNISLEEITSITNNYSVSDSLKIEEGDSYIVETANGHLAKFRFINPSVSEDKKSYSFTIAWVYQPNNRNDFYGSGTSQ